MGLDLGELSIRVRVDDSEVPRKLEGVKRSLDEVARSAGQASNTRVDIKTSGERNLDQAAGKADRLEGELDEAGRAGRNLRVSEQPATELAHAESKAKDFGNTLGKVASKGVKWVGVTAGTAAIGGLGTALTKGFSRLNSIDQATAKLEALGNTSSDVSTIMDNALTSVKGTAYGIGEAAGTAATMVAAGVKPGQELEGVLKGVADSAAIAGVGMDEMGLIWGKAAAKTKIDGEIVNQLLERQIPIYDILSQKTGEASSDIADMVSKGKIDFKTFSEAMNDYVGGGAVRMGQTFSGAMDNLGAALGRAGEALLKAGFEAAPELLSAATDAVDDLTERITPLAAELGASLAPKLAAVGKDLGPSVAAAFGMVADAGGVLLPIIGNVAGALADIPWPVVAGGVAALIAQNKGLTSSLSSMSGKFGEFGSQLASNRAAMMAQNSEVSRMGATISALGTQVPVIGRMTSAFQSASTPLRLMGMESRAAASQMTGMGRVAGTVKGGIQTLGGVAAGAATGGMSLLKSGAKGVMSMFGGPWGLAIMGATTALGYLIDKHYEAKKAEEAHQQAQRELRGTLDETTGSITKQTEELVRKRLEESGAAEGARQVGIGPNDLVAAVNGDTAVQRRIQDKTRGEVEAAARDTKRFKVDRATGVDVEDEIGDITSALLGDEGAKGRVGSDKLQQYRDQIREGSNDVAKLGTEISDLNQQFEDSRADVMADRVNNLASISRQTSSVMEMLGDKIVSIPDDKTIIVSSMAPEVKKELEDLGLEVERLPDGTVKVSFPDGMNVIQALDSMGVKIKQLPDGTVDISDNSDEVKQRLVDMGLAAADPVTGQVTINDNIADVIGRQVELGEAVRLPETGEVFIKDNAGQVMASLSGLGIAAQTIPAGRVRVVDDTPQARQNLQNLGIQTQLLPGGFIAIGDTTPENERRLAELGIRTQNLPPGWVQITDTSDANMARLQELGVKTTTLPNGDVIITDNANDTLNHIKSTLSKENTNTFSDHVISITRKIRDIFENAEGGMYAPFADGGVAGGGVYRAFAGGGTERAVERAARGVGAEPPHTAHIAGPGTYRVFAEPETGGEAYIPLAPGKRARSEKILGQVAKHFGLNVVDNQGRSPAGLTPVVLGKPGTYAAFADGGLTAWLRQTMDGKEYIWGGHSTAGADCSGLVSIGVNKARGYDPFGERMDTSWEGQWLSSRGAIPGAGSPGDLRVGWNNQHTAMTLPDGVKAESGGGHGYVAIGGPATGHDNPTFTEHMHLPASILIGSIGDAGLSDLSELEGTVGGGYAARSTTPTAAAASGSASSGRVLNGGAGTLLRDGSVLELAAALYSKQTGEPMQDDIVSWGQALGLYSDAAETDTGAAGAGQSAELQDLYMQRDQAESDLPAAEAELDAAKARLDDLAEGEDPAEAQADVDAAQARVDDLRTKIDQLNEQIERLEQTLNRPGVVGSIDPYSGLDSNLPGSSGNKNADAIIREGRRRGISDTGIKIALATGLVESELQVYANPAVHDSMGMPHDAVGGDRDSVGIFQQRDNGAWGTLEDRMDPARSAGMFYDRLDDEDYNTGDPGAHAQRVQASAFPGRYAQRMDEAQALLDRFNQSSKASNPGKITAMADGGILGNARQAQIRDTSAVLWAEAGPEAYIPLSSNKRARSLDIWAETGKRLGVDVLSMINFLASGLPGMVERGSLDGVSTGSSVSLEGMGLNTEAASYRLARGGGGLVGQAGQAAVGAVFNGPVQINDPRQYLRGQLDHAERALGSAMRSVMM